MKVYNLYNGAVELEFDEDRHKYFVNGEEVDGVTTVLKVINKAALVPWAAKMSAEFVEAQLKAGAILDELQIKQLVAGVKTAYKTGTARAADIGTLGHEWAESYLLGGKPSMPINPQLANIAQAVTKFVTEHDIQVLTTERPLYSMKHKVAGTTDIIANFEGELAIMDWKTGSGIYPEVFAQLGGYSMAYSEETGQQVKSHVAVNVRKDGNLYVGISKNVKRNESAFKAALSLDKYVKELTAENKKIVRKIK